MRLRGAFSIAFAALAFAGCVRREIDITSTPDGALVLVNDREVGRTPCRVDFDHYGLYDVRLTLDGYESIVGVGETNAPVWDWVGVDLLSEMAPFNLVSNTKWHFNLTPSTSDPAALVRRARALQSDLIVVDANSPVERALPEETPGLNDVEKAKAKGVSPMPPTLLEGAGSAAGPGGGAGAP